MTLAIGQLLVEEPAKPPRIEPLKPPKVIIGRLSGPGRLALGDSQVGLVHVELRVGEAGVVLQNLKGVTTVNDNILPAQATHKLEVGDIIKIGSSRLTCQVAGATLPDIQELVLENGEQPKEQPDGPLNRRSGSMADRQLLDTKRPKEPAPLAPGLVSKYLRYLPSMFQDTGYATVTGVDGAGSAFLGRYLNIFESIWEPLEQRQDFIELYFDPATCPADMLPWLAEWFGLTLDTSLPEDRSRAMVAKAFELLRWRGTPYGLQLLLELSTGLEGIKVVEAPQECLFHVTITIPRGTITRAHISQLIEAHKPAHAGYTLTLTEQ